MELMEFGPEMNVMSVDLLDKVFIKILILETPFGPLFGYTVVEGPLKALFESPLVGTVHAAEILRVSHIGAALGLRGPVGQVLY